jgi:transcriptional regulator
VYVPPHFNEPRVDALHELIEKNPLAVLVTHGKNGLDANHIPFDLNKDQGTLGRLHAHVARANPLWQEIAADDEVLVVFRGGDAYISPGWYPSKHEFHRQVPTWNYRVAHAYGRITIHDNDRYVRGLVAKLTRTHETAQTKPWKMTDSSKEFIAMMLTNIVGVEIEITRLIGKFKLSQNKEDRDILGASHALKAQGHNTIGDAMLTSLADRETEL